MNIPRALHPEAPCALQPTMVPAADSHLASLWEIYESAFPPEERRDKAGFYATIEQRQPDYQLQSIVDAHALDVPVGLLAYWSLQGEPSVYFLEHLAVAERYRNQKRGKLVMRHFLKTAAQHDAMVVLEVEPPAEDPITMRRLQFYQRLGFVAADFAYLQPPYTPGEAPVPLQLLSARPASHPDVAAPLNRAEFVAVRHMIHTAAYGLSEPITT